MHLVEQLQVKRTEANNRLLSRKRKLSELFAATVRPGDHSTTAANQQYHQQLQAFYDANDLQKGRRFHESTLPPRTPVVRIQKQPAPKPTNLDIQQSLKNARRSKSPSKPNLPTPPFSKDPESKISDDELASVIDRGEVLQRPEASPRPSQQSPTSSGDAVPAEDSIPSGGNVGPGSSATTGTNLEGKRLENGDGGQNATKNAEDSDVVKSSSDFPTTTDRHSSPASSRRRESDTPIPIGGSPDTSPGDEEPPLSQVLQPVQKHESSSAHAHPPTPDPETESTRPAHKMSVSSIDVDMMDDDPIAGFDSPLKAVAPPEQSLKDTPSRKPPIRINTETGYGRADMMTSSAMVETPLPLTGFETPRQQSLTTPISAIDTTKRATRISSGALQKKSVSEILGEVPKSTSPRIESPIPINNRDSFSLSTAQGRQADRERKERERTKLSTVVFAKPQRPSDVETIEVVSNTDLEKANSGDRDYLYTLFESKAYSSKSGSLSHLIQHSHKAISTTDHIVDYEYQAQCRVLKRLYQLQSADRWALRQRKRADEPPRPTSHWDFLLDHAKWMRTDFREERKWKYAAARTLAECCAEWVASTPEERKLLQVQIVPPQFQQKIQSEFVPMEEDPALGSSHPTPDLLPSGEDESVSDDIADPQDVSLSNAPAAIFSLGANDFNFVADRTPAFDKLINELPLYEPAKIEPDLAKSNLAERLDARWKTDIVPVSRFATEKLVVKEHKAPVKRSRYDYELESSPQQKTKPLPPRDAHVGLFMPENKHIRDRIHPGHSFRPPSEHPMPTQSFFETRSSSQWTAAEDDELRKLVKDYSYNWSLISSCLTSRSLYSSSPDRRTPWECFERWIGLEGMPADMAKTPYFRTYSGRIEAAGRHIQAQIEEAQRRAGPNVPIPTRKRTTQPVRVERKRASRHLAMLDAMRKLAKKREVHRQKQAHSADMAAMRKSNEINQPRLGAKTPAEWSQLKHEREQKLAKQQELYRQQLIAHQRAATAQQQRGPSTQGNGVPNGIPQSASNVRAVPHGAPVPGMANGQMAGPNGVSRPHPAMMGVPNGMQMPNGMAVPKGFPAQIQANMRSGVATSPQQMRILNEAQKMHQEQLMRQAQQNGNHSSPNAQNSSMANGHGMNNPAFMAAMAGATNAPSPGAMSGNSGSPRGSSMGQALSSGHVPVLAQIAASIKERHPNMTDEEVQRHATQQLTQWQQQATAAAAGQQQRPRVNQAALNAAMGAANAAANAGMAAAAASGSFPQNMTPEQLQQYNQRLRMQHAQHAARGMQGQLQPNMMAQMNNSPVMNMSRPVSQHNNQAMSRSATPRDQRSGSVTNVAPTAGGSMLVNGTSAPMNGVQGQGQLQPGQQGSPRANQPQSMQT